MALTPDTSLHLFGTLRFVVAKRTLTPPSASLALLGYLGLYAHDRAVSRTRIAGSVWPDVSESRARRNLADALYRLRQPLGAVADALFSADEDTLALHRIWIDVNEFRTLAGSSALADRRAAIDLYTGDLLEDIDTEWVMGPRAALRQQYLAVLEQTCLDLIEAGEAAEALTLAHRWTVADPLNEAAHTTAMRLYAGQRRHAVALQHYTRLKELLADELQIEPMPETRALAEAIRLDAEPDRPAPTDRVFVGHRRERARLIELAEQAQAGHGGLCLLEGEAGFGKTLLLEKAAEAYRWRGLTVVWGKARQLGGTITYAPFDEALQAAIGGPRADRLRAALKPDSLETLGRLIPRLAPSAFSPHTDRESLRPLSTALVDSCLALAAFGPHVWIFDDVQWAEAGFWETLVQLAPLLFDQRILIVLACRGEALRAEPAVWQAIAALDRDLTLTRLTLTGLTVAECGELARVVGRPIANADEVATLQRLTGGSPLYVRELIEQRDAQGLSFDDLLGRRLAALAAPVRSCLEAAAVVGREFTHGLWQALAGRDVLTAIPLLIAQRFIEETEHGYRLQHDLTHEYVYRRIEPDVRRDWHRRVGELLVREHAEPDRLAWQFEQAEHWPEAVRYYREAGERAAHVFAYQAALDHYDRALKLLPRLDAPQIERVAILHGQEYALSVLLRHDEWQVAIEALAKAALEAGEQAIELEALGSLTALHVIDAHWTEALKTVTHAIWLAQKIGVYTAPLRALTVMGWHMGDLLTDLTVMYRQFKAGSWIAEATGNPTIMAFGQTYLAFAEWRNGHNRAAQTAAQNALTLAAAQPDLRMVEATTLQILAESDMGLAQWDSAQAYFNQSIALKLELNDPLALGQSQNGNVMLYVFTGQTVRARQLLEAIQALPGIRELAPDSVVRLRLTAELIETLIDDDELAQAEQILRPLLDVLNTRPISRTWLAMFMMWGRLQLAHDQAAEAAASLARAMAAWEKYRDPRELPVPLWHAIAACRAGDRVSAQTSLHHAEQVLKKSDSAVYNLLWSFARFELSGSIDDLAAARTELHRQAAAFSDSALQVGFLKQRSLHREIEARWQMRHSSTRQISVLLTRADVPLGRSITDADRVSVRWTIDAGDIDAELLQREGKVALRQQRVRRLLAEAQAQGAAPTDADLAHALDVTERTIERDMAALQTSGTRRRKSSA